MKTTLEFIKLTLLTVGGTIAILLVTGIASFAHAKGDLYKKNLGVGLETQLSKVGVAQKVGGQLVPKR